MARHRRHKHWIFISYRSVDIAIAKWVKLELEQQFGRRTVFIDESIGIGTRWEDILESGVSNCSVFVPIVTANYFGPVESDRAYNYRIEQQEDFVRKELEWALDHERGSTRSDGTVDLDSPPQSKPSTSRRNATVPSAEQQSVHAQRVGDVIDAFDDDANILVCPLKVRALKALPDPAKFDDRTRSLIEQFYSIQYKELDFTNQRIVSKEVIAEIRADLNEKIWCHKRFGQLRCRLFAVRRFLATRFHKAKEGLAISAVVMTSAFLLGLIAFFLPEQGIRARLLDDRLLNTLSVESSKLTRKFLHITDRLDEIQGLSANATAGELSVSRYLLKQSLALRSPNNAQPKDYEEVLGAWESAPADSNRNLPGLELANYYFSNANLCRSQNCVQGFTADELKRKALGVLGSLYTQIEQEFSLDKTHAARTLSTGYCDVATAFTHDVTQPTVSLPRAQTLFDEYFALQPPLNTDRAANCRADYAFYFLKLATTTNLEIPQRVSHYESYLEQQLARSGVLDSLDDRGASIKVLIKALTMESDAERVLVVEPQVREQRSRVLAELERLIKADAALSAPYLYLYHHVKSQHHIMEVEYSSALSAYLDYLADLVEKL